MNDRYAEIIVDVLNQEVDRIFTYAVPDDMPVQKGMRVSVPFGRQRAVDGIVMKLKSTTDVPPERLKSILCVKEETPCLTEEQLVLAQKLTQICHASFATVLRLFVPAELRSGRVNSKFVTVLQLCDDPDALLDGMKPGTKAYRIISSLAEYGEMDKAQLSRLIPGCYEPLSKLVKAGIVAESLREVARSPYLDIAPDRVPFLTLNRRQSRVFDEICSAFGQYAPFLLHGVTGSGKTEIYMQAIHKVVSQGKTAIVLVPEISLTPQMVLNFRRKLGDGVAILHSALGVGERFDEWKRIRTGEARIVIGARSAVFAPCRDVGLIVVDEEHETSYLSETHPRYDAVEVALLRGQYNHCPVILGSATPSVVRYYQMKQGRFRLLEMKARANGHEMPKVEVVDMTEEFSKGNRSIFSEKLYLSMCNTLSRREQLMLFLNRRGYASFVMCRACGETISCENCDVSLTYHAHVDKLRCHYCGYEIPMPKTCPFCGSKFIKQFGAGTQKVEDEFKRLFPGVGVVRMDVDTTRGKDAHYKLLKQLSDGTAQALVGTQMIAKGHDFPKVTLVGVVAADSMLRMPDYRSRERTFSLLTQVSGRAGRADAPGQVVLQTYSPHHFVIECASRHDYLSFYEQEIKERQAMWYPPFARLVRVLYASSDAEKSFQASEKGYEKVLPILAQKQEFVLYSQRSAAPIGRLQELYRHQILIKLKEFSGLDELVDEVISALDGIAGRDVYCDIQINPVNMF